MTRRCAWVLFLLLSTPRALGFSNLAALPASAGERPAPVREIAWDDIAPPIQHLLTREGITGESFPAHISELRRRNQARLREGDLDHLVYYMLQSLSFTRLQVVEPAESAAAFVGRLPAGDRARFIAGKDISGEAIPESAMARIAAFAAAIDKGTDNTKGNDNIRLAYFRELLAREHAAPALRAFLSEQYVRAMRFLYEKEFDGKGGSAATLATSALYQDRGLSTDTSVDAGYVVYLALATLRGLEPGRRIRNALIIGPGLDLAPRTGLVETIAPQSYQPFAVMDALFGIGLAEASDLRVSAIDINPGVVDWLRTVRGTTPQLTLFSGIAENERVRLTDDYRAYFVSLGRNVGLERPIRAVGSRRLAKIVRVSAGITAALDASTVDITVERADDRYDLIVVTNVFPYLSDPDLLLALSNIVRMLKPGGILLHNEPRPLLANAILALSLPLMHSRSAVVATVERGVSPLYDSIWMHRAPD